MKKTLSEVVLESPVWKDIDVVVKYKKYPEFKKQLDKIQKQYLDDLNMSLYSSLQHLQKLSVFEIIDSKSEKKGPKFYLCINAFKLNQQEEEQQKLYYLFIKLLDQKLRANPQTKYSIIYYHSLSESTNLFSFLNEAFKKLPIYYYAMLDKIYVVQPSFVVKNTIGMFDFGRLHKIFSKRLVYVDKLYEMGKIQEIQNSKVLDSLPVLLKQQKALKEQKKAQKHGALQNIQNKAQKKSQETSHNQPQKLMKKTDCLTIPLENHKLTADGLPIIFGILLESLKARPEYLKLQGIFRKSGSIEEEQQIIEELSKLTSIEVLKKVDQYSGMSLAGVVKKFLTKLEDPIVPFDIYYEILSTKIIQDGKEVQYIRAFLSKLPGLNRKVLAHLFFFLKQHVVSKKQFNRMNSHNIAICFFPCIFRSKQNTLEDLMSSGRYIQIIDVIITKFEQFFPKQQIKLISGKQNRSSKGSKGSRGSRNSKENSKLNKEDSPTKI